MSKTTPNIAPYKSIHQNVSGPGDGRPEALQIVKDQGLDGKLSHLTFAVTGGNTGLGKETTRALHATGARIFILAAPGTNAEVSVREIERLNKEDERLADQKNALKTIEVIEVDLGSLKATKDAAAKLKEQSGNRLNVLVCNAGVMTPPFKTTKDGFEPHFGINYLGHFYLFNELVDTLIQSSSASKSFASRVVVLSSLAHKDSNIDPRNLPPTVDLETDTQTVSNLYGDSKIEILWMSNEIERRFGNRGVHSFSVSPGSIVTPLTAHIGWDRIRERTGTEVLSQFDQLTKNLEQGAATTTWAAIGHELEGKGGLYLDDVQVANLAEIGAPVFAHGYATHAYNESKERELWDVTVEILKSKGITIQEQ